ncbi:hypothetical protein QUF75_17985 [Desulfococcaceae bacterium HSG7]|nr:hypothetical protein [Desulfococcaceae bacterium HSG7]
MIAVFGASVTQQKNGFTTKLNEHFNVPIKVFGYGGMHLNNAAICFIDEVIEQRPDYCFFDWFSTAYNESNDKTVQYIDTILNKCSKINCKPIFLFLPFRSTPNKRNFHRFCQSVLNDKKVFFIDVNTELQKYDINKILRDNVHTTEYGSSLYSKIIYAKFKDNKDNIIKPNGVSETQYSCIKKIMINREFKDFLKLSGNCEIIGFLLTIGPHSGLINVVNGSESYNSNTWDRSGLFSSKKILPD